MMTYLDYLARTGRADSREAYLAYIQQYLFAGRLGEIPEEAKALLIKKLYKYRRIL